MYRGCIRAMGWDGTALWEGRAPSRPRKISKIPLETGVGMGYNILVLPQRVRHGLILSCWRAGADGYIVETTNVLSTVG